MAKISVKMSNPGKKIEIEVDDSEVLKLLTDCAETKTSLTLLWRVVLLGMGTTGSISLAGLIAQVA